MQINTKLKSLVYFIKDLQEQSELELKKINSLPNCANSYGAGVEYGIIETCQKILDEIKN